jgi:heterodisulfide reductase subunit A
MTQTSKSEEIEPEGEPRVGVFICHCGLNIAGTLDIAELVNFSQELPNC